MGVKIPGLYHLAKPQKWSVKDSNLQPVPYERTALTIEPTLLEMPPTWRLMALQTYSHGFRSLRPVCWANPNDTNRTCDFQFPKLALYHLSYIRKMCPSSEDEHYTASSHIVTFCPFIRTVLPKYPSGSLFIIFCSKIPASLHL